MKLLEQIKKPNDIKKVPKAQYDILAREIRAFILEAVSENGGHLASNLGAVELTMALHSVLDFPKDKLVWDVGHQAYTHKILTGRQAEFGNLRQLDGLSGFPKRYESDCDSFDTGHSSTSISAALGMATASKLNNDNSKVVAVIGDGALTGGMALEALNNVAELKKNFVIILNDNTMSISENVGGMSKYLNKLRVGTHYNEFKEDVEHKLSKIPKIGGSLVKGTKNVKDHIKNLFVKQSLFDDLGITYIGPIDGHNVEGMISIFENALKIDHPILLHVKTVKGKGYKFAEKEPTKYHGVAPFDLKKGVVYESSVMSYTDVFSTTLVKMAKENEKILAITAAMPDGTGLIRFRKAYPKRFFDVGIAEEHAVTFAAGLAASGYKPFVSIYSSFYQRAYDQIIHDVCMQNLPVTFILDRAGLVGQDGETHQGVFDISFLSAMPNLVILAPKSLKELVNSMKFAEKHNGPIAIRFPRGAAYVSPYVENEIIMGKGEILKEGKDIAIIAVGNIIEEAAKAVDYLEEKDIDVTFVNPRFIKPMDEELINNVAKNHKHIILVEEGIKKGGFSESVETYILENKLDASVEVMAIDDVFVEQGKIADLRKRVGISYQNIYDKVLELV